MRRVPRWMSRVAASSPDRREPRRVEGSNSDCASKREEEAMGSSTLTPDNLPAGRDRRVRRGHGTEALGPSDSSDTGSDVQGAHGLAHDADRFGLERGTNEDPDESRAASTGGPDVGDGNLDSDSDAEGTGEHAAAGRDTL